MTAPAVTVTSVRIREGEVLNLAPGAQVFYRSSQGEGRRGTYHSFVVLTPLTPCSQEGLAS